MQQDQPQFYASLTAHLSPEEQAIIQAAFAQAEAQIVMSQQQQDNINLNQAGAGGAGAGPSINGGGTS